MSYRKKKSYDDVERRNEWRRSDRRESPSTSRKRFRRKSSVEDEEDTRSHSHNDDTFSFDKHRHDFNKVFTANQNLVQDVDDFWRFLMKFEAVERKRGAATEPWPEAAEAASAYHRSYCINVRVNLSFGELFARVPQSRDVTDQRMRKFQEIINLYLDFKQKEKFAKLKKLRETQAGLPVYQHKDEIVETIKNERVVIIAGDTGCGKSTQVPQYLYKAGFGKIGEKFESQTMKGGETSTDFFDTQSLKV